MATIDEKATSIGTQKVSDFLDKNEKLVDFLMGDAGGDSSFGGINVTTPSSSPFKRLQF